MIKKAYKQGFIKQCLRKGVKPSTLVKKAYNPAWLGAGTTLAGALPAALLGGTAGALLTKNKKNKLRNMILAAMASAAAGGAGAYFASRDSVKALRDLYNNASSDAAATGVDPSMHSDVLNMSTPAAIGAALLNKNKLMKQIKRDSRAMGKTTNLFRNALSDDGKGRTVADSIYGINLDANDPLKTQPVSNLKGGIILDELDPDYEWHTPTLTPSQEMTARIMNGE